MWLTENDGRGKPSIEVRFFFFVEPPLSGGLLLVLMPLPLVGLPAMAIAIAGAVGGDENGKLSVAGDGNECSGSSSGERK